MASKHVDNWIKHQLVNILSVSMPGVTVTLNPHLQPSGIHKLDGVIFVRPDNPNYISPFQDSVILFEITFPLDYPSSPPKARFLSKVTHPYVAPDGTVDILPILSPYSPLRHNLADAILFLKLILHSPEDPLKGQKDPPTPTVLGHGARSLSPAALRDRQREEALASWLSPRHPDSCLDLGAEVSAGELEAIEQQLQDPKSLLPDFDWLSFFKQTSDI
eukprot:gnl/Dysnectes_brevis/4066_a5327_544.p1 GENE.gnl/Dysnectes_brevis/4066_a5327_544~~gnl/Dysnectes_brevis/4066_a5327_544.p1  ORF type:complete len:218 (+),score=51.02 gnl/Dysnectes_brevis/4066_a5327_544:29-682(+)